MLSVLTLACVAAFATAQTQTVLLDSQGQPAIFASRPVVYFVTCLKQQTGDVLGLETRSTHLLAQSRETGRLIKHASYDTDLQPYLVPYQPQDPKNCAGFGVAIGNMWTHYFGFSDSTDPATVIFTVHAPLRVKGQEGNYPRFEAAAGSEMLRFSCSTDCHSHVSTTSADFIAGMILLAFFVCLLLFLMGAVAYNEPFFPPPPPPTTHEIVIRDERKK